MQVKHIWIAETFFFSCQVCYCESIVLIILHIHAYLAVTPMINGSSISVLYFQRLCAACIARVQ